MPPPNDNRAVTQNGNYGSYHGPVQSQGYHPASSAHPGQANQPISHGYVGQQHHRPGSTSNDPMQSFQARLEEFEKRLAKSEEHNTRLTAELANVRMNPPGSNRSPGIATARGQGEDGTLQRNVEKIKDLVASYFDQRFNSAGEKYKATLEEYGKVCGLLKSREKSFTDFKNEIEAKHDSLAQEFRTHAATVDSRERTSKAHLERTDKMVSESTTAVLSLQSGIKDLLQGNKGEDEVNAGLADIRQRLDRCEQNSSSAASQCDLSILVIKVHQLDKSLGEVKQAQDSSRLDDRMRSLSERLHTLDKETVHRDDWSKVISDITTYAERVRSLESNVSASAERIAENVASATWSAASVDSMRDHLRHLDDRVAGLQRDGRVTVLFSDVKRLKHDLDNVQHDRYLHDLLSAVASRVTTLEQGIRELGKQTAENDVQFNDFIKELDAVKTQLDDWADDGAEQQQTDRAAWPVHDGDCAAFSKEVEKRSIAFEEQLKELQEAVKELQAQQQPREAEQQRSLADEISLVINRFSARTPSLEEMVEITFLMQACADSVHRRSVALADAPRTDLSAIDNKNTIGLPWSPLSVDNAQDLSCSSDAHTRVQHSPTKGRLTRPSRDFVGRLTSETEIPVSSDEVDQKSVPEHLDDMHDDDDEAALESDETPRRSERKRVPPKKLEGFKSWHEVLHEKGSAKRKREMWDED
jgi:uncharacterized coiled-coil protein SlyX